MNGVAPRRRAALHRAEVQPLQATAEALPGRAEPVGGQLQDSGRPFQAAAPVGEPLLQPDLGQLAPLPGGVIGVLHGRERQILPLVEGCQLAQQDPGGPAVGDGVVDGQAEPVMVRRQPQQQGARQGTLL